MSTVKVNLKSGRFWEFTKTEFPIRDNLITMGNGGCLVFGNDRKSTIIPADAIESIEITEE